MSLRVGRKDGSTERSARTTVRYVVIGGAILGVAGVWTAVTHHPSQILVVRYVAVGLACLSVGHWLSTKGHGRLGLLIALTGALWFIPELQDTRQGLLVGIATLLEGAYLATYAHAVLAYPEGRIRPSLGTWFVGAGYLLVLVGGTARALTYQPYYWQSCDCPHNSFAVWHTESVYNGINDFYQLIGFGLGIALIVLLAVKLRPAKRDGVRLPPVWAALIGTTLMVVSGLARDRLDLSHNGVIFWLWVEGVGLLLAVLSLLVLREPSETPR